MNVYTTHPANGYATLPTEYVTLRDGTPRGLDCTRCGDHVDIGGASWIAGRRYHYLCARDAEAARVPGA